MRKLVFLLAFASAAGQTTAPKPAAMFRLVGHVTNDPAVTAGGRRTYYVQDSTELLLYDRTTGKHTHVLGNVNGQAGLAVSEHGDRLAFCRAGEDGDGPFLWTVTLDPATGLPNAQPRRVSLLKAAHPAFSPDAKSIAFAVPTGRVAENLVVVPTAGGPERVIAQTSGDVWPIRWFLRDSISFGLSFGGREDASRNGIYRVGVNGGPMRLVTRTGEWGTIPGLSPDGRFIVAADSTWDSLVVSTSSGRRLAAFAMHDDEPTPDVWAGNTHAVGWHSVVPRRLEVVDLESGKSRPLTDSTSTLYDPQWSSDGRHLVTVRGPIPGLVMVDVGTSANRAIRIGFVCGPFGRNSVQWSPDGRSLLCRQRHAPNALRIVEVASGTERRLAPASELTIPARWTNDSRSVLYATVDSTSSGDSARKFRIHEVTVNGQDRVLHTVLSRCALSLPYCGKFANDSLFATWSDGEYRMTNFRTRAPTRVVYKSDGDGLRVPTFSADGQWMAVRRRTDGDTKQYLELMRADGSSRKTIPVSFNISPGEHNPWVSPDGKTVIVASGNCQRGPCAEGQNFYRIDVSTGNATLVAKTPHAIRQVYDSRVSPDGRSLAYIVDMPPYVDFYDFDFSSILKSAPSSTGRR